MVVTRAVGWVTASHGRAFERTGRVPRSSRSSSRVGLRRGAGGGLRTVQVICTVPTDGGQQAVNILTASSFGLAGALAGIPLAAIAY